MRTSEEIQFSYRSSSQDRPILLTLLMSAEVTEHWPP